MLRTRSLIALVLAGGLALAACGSDDSDSTDKESTTTTKAATPDSTAASATATVKVGDTSLGNVLTDTEGKTLYLYADDDGTTSTVPAAALVAWPPIEAVGTPTVGEGLDQAKLTTATQADGKEWVAYNGHLLYRFDRDAVPGDVAGQGVGDVWFVISSKGEKIS